MKARELKEKDSRDLQAELNRLRKELFDHRFQWQAEENPDTSRKRKIRRDMARILTILRERELASQRAGQGSVRTAERGPGGPPGAQAK
jgi:large subunit ribosomal protein L29